MAKTNFPTTGRSKSERNASPTSGIDPSLATIELARELVASHQASPFLRSMTELRASGFRDCLELLGLYKMRDVSAEADNAFFIAISRQKIKVFAEQLDANEAVAIAQALEALTDHRFDISQLAEYFADNARKNRRREQNREAQQRSRARKAGAA